MIVLVFLALFYDPQIIKSVRLATQMEDWFEFKFHIVLLKKSIDRFYRNFRLMMKFCKI